MNSLKVLVLIIGCCLLTNCNNENYNATDSICTYAKKNTTKKSSWQKNKEKILSNSNKKTTISESSDHEQENNDDSASYIDDGVYIRKPAVIKPKHVKIDQKKRVYGKEEFVTFKNKQGKTFIGFTNDGQDFSLYNFNGRKTKKLGRFVYKANWNRLFDDKYKMSFLSLGNNDFFVISKDHFSHRMYHIDNTKNRLYKCRKILNFNFRTSDFISFTYNDQPGLAFFKTDLSAGYPNVFFITDNENISIKEEGITALADYTTPQGEKYFFLVKDDLSLKRRFFNIENDIHTYFKDTILGHNIVRIQGQIFEKYLFVGDRLVRINRGNIRFDEINVTNRILTYDISNPKNITLTTSVDIPNRFINDAQTINNDYILVNFSKRGGTIDDLNNTNNSNYFIYDIKHGQIITEISGYYKIKVCNGDIYGFNDKNELLLLNKIVLY